MDNEKRGFYNGVPDYLSEQLPPIPTRVKEFARTTGFLWGPEENPYGVAGYMTYAPNGAALKHSMELAFWQLMVQDEGFYPIITSSFGLIEQWQASGHYEQFGAEMLKTRNQRGQQLVGRGELATTVYPFIKQLASFLKSRLPFKIYTTGDTKLNFKQTQWQTYTQEYTAHEGHLIIAPEPNNIDEVVEKFMELAFQIMEAAGLDRETLTFREKIADEKPFYARQAWGLFADQFNGLELLGIQYRGSRDFERHAKATKRNLTVNGDFPEVFEISWSTDRPFLCLLQSALRELDGREVLLLPDHLVPYPAEITPSVKRFGLPEQATRTRQKINTILKPSGVVIPAVNLDGSKVTKRFQEADSRGIPFMILVGTDCEEDDFLLRERNSGQQVKTSIQELAGLITQVPWGTQPIALLRLLFDSKQ